ncbi:MAG: dihydrodipicolinate synthase family protein [Chloroflexi bacterium]|nr:MAG: dihydrodipicolinate synthase family protein [Chloroflexota bacterium]TMF41934.1 MAG: dihydrodipicolinate synthase family protein [Chloroflexota bacterium]
MVETPAPQGGIYPPLPTFFNAHEELDLDTLQRHIRRIATSGIAGYVVMGSNGEAVHLSGDERAQVIATTRSVAGESASILAGCGEQSTRATIANCQQAAQAGANFALVLPPFYFKGRMDKHALLAHYRTVADNSPLPIVIYNMPANTAGLDLDAATICALAEHHNIIAVKDSSGNMAKLSQIGGQTPTRFRVFAGSAGYLLPALSVGAVGAVAALANIFPREVCRLQELFYAGQLEEARLLQARLAPANTAVTATYSVPGLKAALDLLFGYGGRPRSPLQPLNEQERAQLASILNNV